MTNKELIYGNYETKMIGKHLKIVHFNDVYNIESCENEPKAGAARFINAVEEVLKTDESTIILFSGDAISPSNISMIVKGKQMIEILNNCHITCACLGNHDFDFGLDVLENHIKDSNFPWLLSNVFDIDTNKPFTNVKDRYIIETNGIKIGLIGLVEEEWIATLSTINFDDIIYESFIEMGKKLAIDLKTKEKCDIVIALTHMRWNNDIELAENVPEIDIILGGHDHEYSVKQAKNGKWIVKSGTDFREFSLIEINLSETNQTNESTISKNLFQVEKIEKYIIDSKVEEKEDIKEIVESYIGNLNNQLDEVLGYMNIELEGRFNIIRTQETNLGNFVTDIMLASVNADCAIINSGSFRSDTLHPIGEFKVRDLKKILPYLDESVVLCVKGSQLIKALENGVSQFPKNEGRFLQVSGIQFAFDPSQPAGKRINPKFVKIQDELINEDKEYSVITKKYLKEGKDGFDCLTNCKVLIDEENIPVLYNLVENHFKTIAKLKKDRTLQKFRSSIIPLFLVNRLIHSINDELNQKEEETNSPKIDHPKIDFQNAAYLITRVLSFKNKAISKLQRNKIKQCDKYQQRLKEYEEEAMKLCPEVEKRIIQINDEKDLEIFMKQSKF